LVIGTGGTFLGTLVDELAGAARPKVGYTVLEGVRKRRSRADVAPELTADERADEV
jgi:hypothetical protein